MEEKLWQPTFIMEHPTEIPLARANDQRPEVTERFELYITGRDSATAFLTERRRRPGCPLSTPRWLQRTAATTKPCSSTTTSVRALEYGMPPPAAAASASTA